MDSFSNNPKSELTLEKVRVLYVNDDKDKYGKSITVEVDDKNEQLINEWAEFNDIKDKSGNILRVLKNDTYDYKYFYFRPIRATEYTDSAGVEKFSFDDLTEDSTISLTAMTMPYKYKDEQGQLVKGTTYRLMAVVIHESVANIAKESAQRLLDKVSKTNVETNNGPEEIDLSSIPF